MRIVLALTGAALLHTGAAFSATSACPPAGTTRAQLAELRAANLAELSQVMRDASICGLGQAAPNPIRCVIKYFPKEIQ